MQVKHFKITRKGIFKSQSLFSRGGGGGGMNFRLFHFLRGGGLTLSDFVLCGIWHLLLDEQKCLPPPPPPQERELYSSVISSGDRLNCFVAKTKFLNSLQLQHRVQESISSVCQSLF